MTRRLPAALLLALLTGCATAPVTRPERFPTLPSFTSWRGVKVEATFYTNHAEIFDGNLIENEGIVPVALRIGKNGDVKEDEGGGYRIQVANMDLRLYLPDGTSLASVDYKDVGVEDEDVADRVTTEALKIRFLDVFEDSDEGFVFFRLEPREAFESLGETGVLHHSRPLARELSFSDALMEFVVTTNDLERQPIRVGLQEDRRAEDGS